VKKIWYEDEKSDKTPIISSRIRLARNLSKYYFPAKMSQEDSKNLIADITSSLKNISSCEDFNYIEMSTLPESEKISMVERHEISFAMLKSQKPCGTLANANKSINIMINEEDHLRIQTVLPGKNIGASWDLADKIDNIIEETLDYAFDKDFGYLTSCPSNTGTGLRASYMVHIPMLEKTGKIQDLMVVLAKLGMTIRGIYGEGSEPLGSIYQISNQVTLGKTEQEIIEGLDNIANKIIENENGVLSEMLNSQPAVMEDNIHRSLGILKTARIMPLKEAMGLLSAVRLGLNCEIIKESRPNLNIYNIMMNVEPGNLQKIHGENFSENEKIDILRAEYLRNMFS